MSQHNKYMQRCLQLARNGSGSTFPNPLVGSVIVDENDNIIGEGWHKKAGLPHAEVNAILNAQQRGYDDYAFAKAVLYVNLEPCSHTGKTPPCASLIVEKGFKKVVIGTLDPHDKVAGNGVALLRKNGITVTIGILEKECNELNKKFFTYHKKNRPYIMLKWAETSDGFIAPAARSKQQPVWITDAYSRQLSHKLRAQEMAILVGAKTVIEDNPTLTCRDYVGSNPQRYVMSNGARLNSAWNIFNSDATTTIITDTSAQHAVNQMYNDGIQSVIIEGGAKTLQQFINANLWDEAHQFMGTEVLFHSGKPAPRLKGNYKLKSRQIIENDVLKIYYNL